MGCPGTVDNATPPQGFRLTTGIIGYLPTIYGENTTICVDLVYNIIKVIVRNFSISRCNVEL